MNDPFIIQTQNDRTTARIRGLAPGGGHGAPPRITPVFLPMAGCPHACRYCNQNAITGAASHLPPAARVDEALRTYRPLHRRTSRPGIIAFYGGNFLGLPAKQVHRLLAAAAACVARGNADGIRFSTRPDTITHDALALIGQYPVTTIELGVQSLDDRVLALSQRGHDAACVTKAASMVKAAGYTLGLQMMTGLPGDTPEGALQTAEKMVAMAPDMVRIYPALVLAGSPLARRWRRGAYSPERLETAVDLVSRLFLVFTTAGIRVIRMGLQADETLAAKGTILAGPYHPAFGERVYAHVFFRLAKAAIARHATTLHPIGIRVHPRHLSQMIGAGRANIARLKNVYRVDDLPIKADEHVTPHHLEVDNLPTPVASR